MCLDYAIEIICRAERQTKGISDLSRGLALLKRLPKMLETHPIDSKEARRKPLNPDP